MVKKVYKDLAEWMRLMGIKRFRNSDVEIEMCDIPTQFDWSTSTSLKGSEAVSSQDDPYEDLDTEPELSVMEDPLTYGSQDPGAVPRLKVQTNWK